MRRQGSRRTVAEQWHTDREHEMTVAMILDNPKGSQEIYERIRTLVGVDRPAGGICHLARPRPDGGWRVIEVWESEEQAQRFYEERVRLAAEAVGVTPPPPPELWAVHRYAT